VFRSLDVKMVVTKTMHDPNNPQRPIICFAGEVAHSSSAMTGQVKMTPDGQVRWQFVGVNIHHADFNADISLRSLVIKEIRFGGVWYNFLRFALPHGIWAARLVFKSEDCTHPMVL
jgi:hypothetical protein